MTRKLSVALTLIGLLAGTAFAAEREQDSQDYTPVLKASETIELTVVNREAEELGEIHDLVISPDGERVSHVVVSAGGFLGLGDKLLPVPIEAVDFAEQTDGEDWVATIDITKERLKNAPNMEANDWSDLTTQGQTDRLNAYYDVDQEEEEVREIGKASEMIGMSIRNEASDDAENVGELNELVFEVDSGKIRYAAMSFGGWLGLGDKLFAVPWQHIAFARPAGEDEVQYLTLTEDISKEALEAAEGFSTDDWPARANENWLSGDAARPEATVADRADDRQR
jgi:sporulation protein YlmC with PRC-barrel domain